MEAPLTHGELRKELARFLHSELKQVFEQIVRSELQQELSQRTVAQSKGDELVRVNSSESQWDSNHHASSPRAKARKKTKWSRYNYAPLLGDQEPGVQDVKQEEEGEVEAVASSKDRQEQSHPRSSKLRMHRPEDLAEIELLIEHETEMNQDRLHQYLPFVSGVMVLANAACIGCETNHRLRHDGMLPPVFNLIDLLFCVFFVLEITLRVACRCRHFFFGEDKYWNLFDFVVVSLQVVEQVTWHVHALRALRVLRIIRVIRIVRVLHLFEELHFIVASITKTLGVVFWFCLLLLIMVYLFSVLLLEMMIEDGNHRHDNEDTKYWFGSVPRTIFTMFEAIAGGVSWDECANVLLLSASPYACMTFILYIVITMLAVLNMLTGLFVDRSMHMVKEERDFHVAAKINNLFLKNCQVKEVDLSTFLKIVQDRAMLDYMEELGLSSNECEDLFHLLDEDQSGSINSDEIVDGCLRLRGPARALDLALVMREIKTLKSLFDMAVKPTRRLRLAL